MKKKTKRNLIIAAIVIVLIAAGAAWFAYPFIRYGLHFAFEHVPFSPAGKRVL